MHIQEALPNKRTATLKKTQVFLDSKILFPRDQQQASFESRQALTGRVTVFHYILFCNSKALKSEIPQVEKFVSLP